MPNRIFLFVFYLKNIHIYNLFYMCTLACIWALFLKISLFVFVCVCVCECVCCTYLHNIESRILVR